MSDVAGNLEAVRERINVAVQNSGRSTDAVSLVAVSKIHDVESVRTALAAGQRVFGENRVQEAVEKFSQLRQQYPDLELHLIGSLQTNKVDDAVRCFDVIETLDRPKLADALAVAMRKQGRNLPCYIEVNIGGELQKSGVAIEQLYDFYAYCHDVCCLSIVGLMCIPPHDVNPRPYFNKLRQLADDVGVSGLSMGMSGDFEQAIACGSTEVRIGTAIFGERS